eukprot:TRINITY_DN1985_c0_g1_i2.p1 TRINITY_DN1985_c0_g1~~TRINITY_DN1985_c0_g1_i2.p1  ORF type:complete len:248 (-),score=68.98 TRINITY_DN1985_c0_g1_i2:445-1188(-)
MEQCAGSVLAYGKALAANATATAAAANTDPEDGDGELAALLRELKLVHRMATSSTTKATFNADLTRRQALSRDSLSPAPRPSTTAASAVPRAQTLPTRSRPASVPAGYADAALAAKGEFCSKSVYALHYHEHLPALGQVRTAAVAVAQNKSRHQSDTTTLLADCRGHGDVTTCYRTQYAPTSVVDHAWCNHDRARGGKGATVNICGGLTTTLPSAGLLDLAERRAFGNKTPDSAADDMLWEQVKLTL